MNVPSVTSLTLTTPVPDPPDPDPITGFVRKLPSVTSPTIPGRGIGFVPGLTTGFVINVPSVTSPTFTAPIDVGGVTTGFVRNDPSVTSPTTAGIVFGLVLVATTGCVINVPSVTSPTFPTPGIGVGLVPGVTTGLMINVPSVTSPTTGPEAGLTPIGRGRKVPSVTSNVLVPVAAELSVPSTKILLPVTTPDEPESLPPNSAVMVLSVSTVFELMVLSVILVMLDPVLVPPNPVLKV